MKSTLTILAVALLTSCAPPKKYVQLLNVSCINCSALRDRYEQKTDSLEIRYYFWGENGIMYFKIENLYNKPIYVDWAKSFFFLNGQRFPYWQDIQTLQSRAVSNQLTRQYVNAFYYDKYFLSTNTSIGTSTLIKPERISYIPPKSSYSPSDFYLISPAPKLSDLQSVEMTDTLKSEHCTPCFDNVVYYRMNYTDTTSDIRFRFFLVWSFDNSFKEENYIDNTFFVNQIMEMEKSIIERKISSGQISVSTSFYKIVKKDNTIEYRKKWGLN